MTSPRFAFSLLLLAPACAPTNDEPPREETDGSESTDATGTETTTSAPTSTSSSVTNEIPTDTSSMETMASTSSTPTTSMDSTDETTEAGLVCGDGLVEGDEVCDDAVNDGSYGGCASDCTALAPHCGDGTTDDAHEMCDDGEANANGTGCNLDCVISGTLLFEYEIGIGPGPCIRITEPAVRDDGNVLFAYTSTCSAVWTLVELSPELDEVASHDATISAAQDQAIVRGTDWILGGYECDAVVTDDGQITEVCNEGRISGDTAIEVLDDDRYVTLLQTDVIAVWGAASPFDGDAPDWTAVAPIQGEFDPSIRDVTPEPSGSVAIVGDCLLDGLDAFYVGRFDADGNLLTTSIHTELPAAEAIRDSPDGSLLVVGSYALDGSDLVRLDANLDVTWTLDACPYSVPHFDIDSAGQIMIDCPDIDTGFLRKLDADGNELWSVEVERESTGLVLDSSDHIIRSTYFFDDTAGEFRLRIEKYAP